MDAKEKLANALEKIMEAKPLDEVHVTEIAKRAGVSKQTFYHHSRTSTTSWNTATASCSASPSRR